jgi:ABC-type transporter Mla subunit MlaD
MANEASKKDLADLEKRINTKLDSVTDSTNKAFKQETDGINKTIDTYNKGFADLTKRLNDLTAVVNQHAKVINEKD